MVGSPYISSNTLLCDLFTKTPNKTGRIMIKTTIIISMMWSGPISLENLLGINFNKDIKSKKEDYVMELHWDYDYYQPWTDNE